MEEPTPSVEQQFLKKLIDTIDANLHNEQFGVNELATELGMSRITLHRKVKAVVKKSVSEFIRETRLNRGYELLQQKAGTVSEIAYKVGFGSVTYFNRCFHNQFGFPPGEVLKGMHPDVEKSPVKNKQSLIQKLQKSKILYIIPVVVFLALIVFQFLKNQDRNNQMEKSIAVLPFKYLSNDTLNQYQAGGMMDAILLNLSKIKDLRVISRTSVNQYQKSDKTARDIGRELNVAYLLEGSFQKERNQIRLIVQLIRTKDEDHIWSNNYDRDWKDIFSLQSEVAENVANELQAAITPEEKQLIRKVPTINLTAYDFYQRGKDLLDNNGDSITRGKAQILFQKALELDSTFALAYVGLAEIYRFKNFAKTYFSDLFLDSVLILANKAIAYDDKCSDAYITRGLRCLSLAKPEMALKDLNKAVELNPNNSTGYYFRAYIYRETLDDYVEAIRNLVSLAGRDRGKRLPEIFGQIGYTFWAIGFNDHAKHYYQEKLKLDGDSSSYLINLIWMEGTKEMEYQQNKKNYESDTTNMSLDLLHNCFETGRYEEAYYYAKKFVEMLKRNNALPRQCAHRIGYAFWMVGKKVEAEYYFNLEKKIDLESIEKGRLIKSRMTAYYDLAGVYAFQGDKEKAYQYLDELNKKLSFPLWWVNLIKHDPLFNSLRDEPRFQAIVKDVEAKYQAEHDRVGKWLAEQGML